MILFFFKKNFRYLIVGQVFILPFFFTTLISKENLLWFDLIGLPWQRCRELDFVSESFKDHNNVAAILNVIIDDPEWFNKVKVISRRNYKACANFQG